MPWYVAHAVMVLRPESLIDQPLYCWENRLLIHSINECDAWDAAEHRARDADASEDYEVSPSIRGAARWEFAGIRKLVEVRHDTTDGSLCDGDELTYNTPLLESEHDLGAFVAGKECRVVYGADVSTT